MRGLIASLVFLATLYSFSEAKSVSTYFKGPKHDEKVELMFTKIDVLKSVIPDEYKQTFISVFSLVFDTSKTPEVRFEEIRKLIPEEVQSKEDFEKKKAIIIGFMGKIDQLANYYTTEVAPTLTDNAKAVIKVYTDYIQQPQQFFKDGKDEMKKKFMDAADKIGEKDALDLFIAAGLMANKAKQIKMMDILDKMKAEKDKNFF